MIRQILGRSQIFKTQFATVLFGNDSRTTFRMADVYVSPMYCIFDDVFMCSVCAPQYRINIQKHFVKHIIIETMQWRRIGAHEVFFTRTDTTCYSPQSSFQIFFFCFISISISINSIFVIATNRKCLAHSKQFMNSKWSTWLERTTFDVRISNWCSIFHRINRSQRYNTHNNNWWIRLHQLDFDCAKPSSEKKAQRSER